MATPTGSHGGLADFNILHGFTEALIRGMRSSFLVDADYHHLTQCETLDDVRLNLTESDYADAVADKSTITPSVLQSAAIEKVCVDMNSETINYYTSRCIIWACIALAATFCHWMVYSFIFT